MEDATRQKNKMGGRTRKNSLLSGLAILHIIKHFSSQFFLHAYLSLSMILIGMI